MKGLKKEYDEYVLTDDRLIVLYEKGHHTETHTITSLLKQAGYKYVGDV